MSTSTATIVFTVPQSLGIHTSGRNVWVGSSQWASELSFHPGGALNVSYDWTDCYAYPDMSNVSDKNSRAVRPPSSAEEDSFQLGKVGLIDGEGNADMTLVSAVYLADQLFNFPPSTPSPALTNSPKTSADLLIHCWSGHSRSVTIAALYIYYKFGVCCGIGIQNDPNGDPVDYSDFDQVLASVMKSRQSPSGTPTTGMKDAAARIIQAFSELFPVPVTTANIGVIAGLSCS